MEATKQADAKFLKGTLTKIVDKTMSVAEMGVEVNQRMKNALYAGGCVCVCVEKEKQKR